jgi:RNA polymerase sigma-70 factor (ECF subfamily)
VLDELIAATAAGEIDHVMRLLSEDAVLLSDGGATVRAARNPVVGPHRIARFLVGLAHRGLTELHVEPVELNGEPGLVLSTRRGPFLALAAEVHDGVVTALHMIRAPEKLASLSLDTPLH